MNIKKQLESRDPYKAVWVSHSSMGDFLKCPRLYYLHNVYKNKSGRKIAIISPHMSLGVAVHNTLENLVNYNSEERIKIISNRLLLDFENNWAKVSGKIGGFVSSDQETEFKSRGIEMIQRVALNPGPLIKKTVHFPPKINNAEKVDMLPHYFLNDTDNIILCGKVDWLEYLPETDSLNVIDFKTGKHEEKEGSLQLPIYQLLLSKLQRRKVTRAEYWYIDRDDAPIAATLYDLDDAYNKVYEVAKKVKSARDKNEYICPEGANGCRHCQPYERIVKLINGDATISDIEYVGKGEYKQDLYIQL